MNARGIFLKTDFKLKIAQKLLNIYAYAFLYFNGKRNYANCFKKNCVNRVIEAQILFSSARINVRTALRAQQSRILRRNKNCRGSK